MPTRMCLDSFKYWLYDTPVYQECVRAINLDDEDETIDDEDYEVIDDEEEFDRFIGIVQEGDESI